MAGTFLRLLVILLGISHLLCLNAVPITRLGGLMHESRVLPEYTNLIAKDNTSWKKNVVTDERADERADERMLAEVNDYPGSGANNRHTPRAQLTSCTDC